YGRKDPETGQAYYGRGYVQLTWKFNYVKACKKLGPDFVNQPDLVMQPDHAAAILYRGMEEGWFTGKSLKTYFGPNHTNWIDARRIINGTDRAKQIADYAKKFKAALDAAAALSTRKETL
ncbi:MAG TPA: glycoside hydrolase family 19 protein, partial [Alphaproteobacteria bacterium]|nr:glycoside hydrolase family 19 protein [Alphaproteobacteria bacterium]